MTPESTPPTPGDAPGPRHPVAPGNPGDPVAPEDPDDPIDPDGPSGQRGPTPVPSVVLRGLLRLLLPREDAEYLLGDLEEDFHHQHSRHGPAGANAWYRRQAAGTIMARLVRRRAPLETWLREARFALRRLARTPGYTCTTAGTLALSIGGVVAIAALALGVLRPLPLPDPGALVAVWESRGADQRWVAPANYLDWRRAATTFSGLAAHDTRSVSVTVDGFATHEDVASVSGNFFDVLGVTAASGRTFDPALDAAFGERVAVISHEAWVTRFGSGSDVVGRTFLADDLSWEIVGVAPKGFAFPGDGLFAWLRSRTEAPELGGVADLPEMRDAWYFQVVGRLSQGADIDAARAEMDAIATRIGESFPDTNADSGILLVPLLEQTVSGFGSTLVALGLAVGLILLAGTVNVLQLTYARAESRGRETAVCIAIGADRRDLRRSAMMEGWLVGLTGALAGLALARLTVVLGMDGLRGVIPRAAEVSVTPGLAAVALGLGLIAGGLIGGSLLATNAPRKGRSGIRGALQNERSGFRGRLLIATQITVAITVGATSGLLGRSLAALASVDLGFVAEDVHTLRVAVPDAAARSYEERIALYDGVAESIRLTPGVTSVGLGSDSPLSTGMRAGVRLEGVGPTADPPDSGWQPIDEHYFDALGMTVLRGRPFTDGDSRDAQDVAIVNEAFVRTVLGGREAIGARVTMGLDGHDRPLTVVGVVADTRTAGPAVAPTAVLYRPLAQTDRYRARSIFVAARSTPGSPPSAAAVRDAVRSVAPGLPVYSQADGIDLSRPWRASQAILFAVMTVFAGTALMIGLIGVYGVGLHAVRRRRSEIGVRMALGATAGQITREVVSRGLHGAALGVVPGLALAVLSGRALESVLYGVTATDPTTLLVASGLVLALTVVVLLPPARLAASVDPARSTREA